MLYDYDPTVLNLTLDSASAQAGMQVLVQPSLLEIAKEYVGVPYRASFGRNPGGAGKPPFMRSKLFRDTLELNIGVGGDLQFRSPAVRVRTRSSHAYGQALIDGTAPYVGPYRMLPPEFYV